MSNGQNAERAFPTFWLECYAKCGKAVPSQPNNMYYLIQLQPFAGPLDSYTDVHVSDIFVLVIIQFRSNHFSFSLVLVLLIIFVLVLS